MQDAIAEGNAATDEELTAEIAAVAESVTAAKEELTSAYQSAISTAIETNNGVIDNKIAQQIQSVNNRIDAEVETLTTRIENIESRLAALEEKVNGMAEDIAALLKRIQSVTYVPQYDDGKIEVRREGHDNGIAEMDFLVSPKDAVSDLEKVWQEAISVKAVHTKTRAVDFIDMPVLGFTADATNGVISVKASGANLGAEFFAGTQSASAALFISDGNNDVTSEYIPLLLNNNNPILPDNVIYYTSSDGETITPKMDNIVSNTYEDGQGVITFSNVVTELPMYAFDYCSSLTSITLPESLTTIGDYAFLQCSSLTSITIPDGVTTIGHCAFASCGNMVSFAGRYASSDQRCLIMDDKLVAFAPYGLTEYTIPNGVTTIGEGAFSYFSSLIDIKLPDSVTTIENRAFEHCSLTNITLPENLTTIENRAFAYCSNLVSITLPESLTTIGESVFQSCSSLKSVYCKPTTPPTLGSSVFYYSTMSIYVPRSSVDAYKSASGWSSHASRIVGYDF